MFLKNYTSDVPASQTIFRIQQVLIKAGVHSLEMQYGPSGQVIAITFRLQFDPAKPPVPIRMPANVQGALEAFWHDYVDGEKTAATQDGLNQYVCYNARKKKRRNDFCEQAERTAWKLVQDWIEVQISMIQMQQADFIQVFLPYVWDGKQTFYSRLKDSGFKALMPPSNSTQVEILP